MRAKAVALGLAAVLAFGACGDDGDSASSTTTVTTFAAAATTNDGPARSACSCGWASTYTPSKNSIF